MSDKAFIPVKTVGVGRRPNGTFELDILPDDETRGIRFTLVRELAAFLEEMLRLEREKAGDPRWTPPPSSRH